VFRRAVHSRELQFNGSVLPNGLAHAASAGSSFSPVATIRSADCEEADGQAAAEVSLTSE
jgi:hypothetical protein